MELLVVPDSKNRPAQWELTTTARSLGSTVAVHLACVPAAGAKYVRSS
jgi:hypothetical protein